MLAPVTHDRREKEVNSVLSRLFSPSGGGVFNKHPNVVSVFCERAGLSWLHRGSTVIVLDRNNGLVYDGEIYGSGNETQVGDFRVDL